jgi:hypothetical protein
LRIVIPIPIAEGQGAVVRGVRSRFHAAQAVSIIRPIPGIGNVRYGVKRVGFVMSPVCPVYPKQQTFPDAVGTSHLCQKQTHASQQIAELFGRLVGECQQRRRHGESEFPGGLGVDDGLEFRWLSNREVGRSHARVLTRFPAGLDSVRDGFRTIHTGAAYGCLRILSDHTNRSDCTQFYLLFSNYRSGVQSVLPISR